MSKTTHGCALAPGEWSHRAQHGVPACQQLTGTPLHGAQSPVASSLSLLEMAPWAGQGWASCGLTTTEKHILEALD